MPILRRLGELSGRGSVLVARAGTLALARVSEAYRAGVAQAGEFQRQTALEVRAAKLGIPAPWYNALAEEFGEEPLMERALQKSSDPAEEDDHGPTLRAWKALLDDPFEPVASWGGWRERPTTLSYEMSELLVRRLGPLAAYIQTRLNQISGFAAPQKDRHGIGFVVRKKHRDPKKKAGEEVDPRAVELTRIIKHCGTTPVYDPETGERRDSFRVFLRKILRDTLVHDQANFEKRRDVSGRVIEWRAVDCKTIRKVASNYTGRNWFDERIRYVQCINGTVAADFSAHDLVFAVRNPRSDIKVYGYGFSEVEMMISTVTALLNGVQHNSAYFSNGTTTKGLLAIHGLVPPNRLRAFKQLWYAMVTGTANAWRTPLLNLPDANSKAEWIDLQKSNLDMEWSKFMEWCLRTCCAVWQIAPEEIGFQLGNVGQTHSLNQGNSQSKVDDSKDRGFPPLLDFLEVLLNTEIMAFLDPDYEIKLAGLDQRTEEHEVELLIKETGSFMMVDEARAVRDLPPLEDGSGKVINNPTWLQAKQQAEQAKQMQQGQGGGGGMPGTDYQGVGGFGGEPEPPPSGQPGGQAGPPPPGGAPGAPGGGQPAPLQKARLTRYEIEL